MHHMRAQHMTPTQLHTAIFQFHTLNLCQSHTDEDSPSPTLPPTSHSPSQLETQNTPPRDNVEPFLMGKPHPKAFGRPCSPWTMLATLLQFLPVNQGGLL